MSKYDININLKNQTAAGGAKRGGKDQTIDLKPIANAISKAIKESLKPVVDQLKELNKSTKKGTPQKKEAVTAKNIASELDKVISRSFNKLAKQIADAATKPTATKTQAKSNDAAIAKALKSLEDTLSKSLGKMSATKGIKIDSSGIAKSVAEAVKSALPKNTGKLINEVSSLSKELDELGRGVTNLTKNLSGSKKDINVNSLLSELKNISGLLKKLPTSVGQAAGTAKSVVGGGKAAEAITKAFNEGVDKLTKVAKEKASVAIDVNKGKLTKAVTEALMKAQREFFGADFIDEKRIEREIKKGVDKAATYAEKKISDAVSKGASKVKVKDTKSEHTVHFKGKGSTKKDLTAKIKEYEKELKELADINLTVNTKGIDTTLNNLQKKVDSLKDVTDDKAFLEFETNIDQVRKNVEDSINQTIRFLERRLSSLHKQQETAFGSSKIKTDPGVAKGFNATTEALKETIVEYKKYMDLMSKHKERFKPAGAASLPTVRATQPVPTISADTKKLSQGIKKDLEALSSSANAIIAVTQDTVNKLSISEAPSKNFDKLQAALDDFILSLQEVDLKKLRKTAVTGFGGDVGKKDKVYKFLRKSIDKLEDIYGSQDGVKKAMVNLEEGYEGWSRDITHFSGLSSRMSKEELESRKKSLSATSKTADHNKELQDIDKQRVDVAKKQLVQSNRAVRSKEPSTATTRPLPSPEVKSYIDAIRSKTPIYKREKAISIPPLASEEITTVEKDISFRGIHKLDTQIRNEIDKNATELGKSLNDLQEYIVKRFEDEFKDKAKGWDVLRDTPDAPAFKLSPGEKQRTLQIANVKRIRQELTKRSKAAPMEATSKELVDLFIEALTEEKIKESPREALLQDVASWLQSVTTETLQGWEGLDNALKESLLNIKSKAGEGLAVDEATVKAIDDVITSKINVSLQQVYTETFGKVSSMKQLQSFSVVNKQGKESIEALVRSIALPAAKLTERGATTLETVHGSQRSLSKFGTYKSGFEVIYEDLLKANKVAATQYEERLRSFGGVTPTKTSTTSAADLKTFSEAILKAASAGDTGYVRERYGEAAAPTMAAALGPQAKPKAIQDFEQNVEAALKGLDNVDDIIKTMADKFNITAFDVVKALDTIKFENIYDIYKKILEAPTGPLEDLVKSPQFNSAVRGYEKAIRQVEQFMPILEPGRPRRARYQESVVNLSAKTSKLFEDANLDAGVEEQKTFIKDLNVRIKELTEVNKALVKAGKEDLPTGVLSSLGLTEAQAGARLQYATGKTTGLDEKDLDDAYREGLNYLKALPGVGVKMFSEDLRSLAPFGEQFQQVGRNISNVSNAMTSSMKSIASMPGEPIKGVAAEMPKLRTAKEEQLIQSGVYGDQGYGFNVLAEMRQTAGTFEDQVLVSGKLAAALTEAVKNLIKPSAAGILGGQGPSKAGPGISKIEEGLVKDIKEVSRKYQEIFGAPQLYEGGADKALIKDVTKTISVVRGQDVELQAAKLAEVFISHFGRKITTRYGSKGVGIKAAEGASKTDILSILEAYGGKKGMIKVLGKEEREKAGLGTAMMPKSMGQLLSELLEREIKQSGKTDTKALQGLRTELVQSGNKFILDIFKDAGKGLVTGEEAGRQKSLFLEASKAFKELYDMDLVSDLKGIKQLQDKYVNTLGALASFFEEKPIDVRISAHGLAKRGLQTEVLESVTANVAATGEGGRTVLQQQQPKEAYEALLGRGGEEGALSKYSGALGYTKAYDMDFATFERELIERFTAGIDKADKPEKYKEQKDLAKRAAQLEKLSSFYVDIIDEFGKKRKSLVGEKFVQVVEEPGKFAEWSPQEIEEGLKGLKLNLPAFAAYSAIFGEGSSFMKDLQKRSYLEDKKQWEYINALRISLGKNQDVAKKIIEALPAFKATDIGTFSERTGSFDVGAQAGKQLRGTISDIDKFSTAFNLLLPTAQKGKTEDFYVPGPLARETYEDPLLAGEYALSDLGRRLQTLVDRAHEVTTAQERPAPLEDIVPAVAGRILEASKGKGRTYLEELKGLLSAAEGSLGEAYYKGPGAEKDITKYATKDVSQLSQIDFINIIEKKSEGDYRTTLYSIMDLIAGPRPEAAGMKPEYKASRDARRQMETVLEKRYKEGEEPLNELLKSLGIENIGEAAIQKKLGQLNDAKAAYYNDLKKLVIGKSGAVGKTIFTKRVPSIMAKAVTAVVDKTEEIDAFGSYMSNLAMEFGDLRDIVDAGTLGDVATAMAEVGKIHSESISKYKTDLEIPVLKQHELAIPPEMAKSLKVSFTKRYGAMGDILEEAQKIDGTLFDLLTYVESLEKDISGDMEKIINVQSQKYPTETASTDTIKKYIEDELAPYIESVRFPFTGISSVQPYRAKLGAPGDKGARALAVPGVPEMPAETFKLFNEQIKKVQGIRDKAMGAREEAWETGDVEKVKRLTDLIDKLNKAISNVIPKYIAHQQKLDFDGDTIQVHTAQNIKSRQEIKKHYDTLMKDVDSTAAVFRDAFTSEAIQAPTGDYVLADMMKSFEKKFPTEKGFDFLKKPFLTEELEYLKPEEQLKILGQTAKQGGAKSPIAEALKGVSAAAITDQADIKQLENILGKVIAGSTDDLAETAKMAVQHIDSLDDSLKNIIYSSIKATLYQEKYKDAIEAQLFKIHTGPETESMTRLQRILETKIGTGGGIIQKTGEFDIDRERTVQMNEFLRFALQKGMDVKHAGGATVSREIVDAIGGSRKDLAMFIEKKLKSEDQPDYSEVRDFIKANTAAIENFLGKKPTEDIRALVSKVSKRGDIETLGRTELKKEYITEMGLEGLLKDLQDQLYSEAARGLLAKGKAPSMDAALKEVERRAIEGELSINKLITEVFEKLYTYRTSSGSDLLKKAAPEDVAKTLEEDLSRALAASNERMGAYSEMVRASITQAKDQNAELLKTAADLQSYDPKTTGVASIVDKILSGEAETRFGIGTGWSGEDADKIKETVAYYTKLAAIPPIPKYKKVELRPEAEELIRPLADKAIKQGAMSDEQYAKEVGEFSKSYINKIESLYQIDKAISVIKQKAKIYESVAGISATKQAPKVELSPRPVGNGQKEVFSTRTEELAIPTSGGGAGAPGKMFAAPDGQPIPVHLASIAAGIIGMPGLKQTVERASLGPRPTPLHEDPVFINELRKIASELSGNINELKGESFEKIFRASGISHGGEYAKKAGREGQLSSIIKTMTGAEDLSKLLDATALMGTGQHEIIEKSMKASSGGKQIDTEELVYLKDAIGGVVTGHIDAIIRGLEGEKDTIVDIKTVMPKVESRLKKLAEKYGERFSDIKPVLEESKTKEDKELLRKLEDAASQVNFYIEAVRRDTGEVLEAEAHFYNRFKTDLKDPATIKFDYDPQRFKDDMQAIADARNTIIEDTSASFAKTASLEQLKEAAKIKPDVSKEKTDTLIKGAKAYYKAMAEVRGYGDPAVPRSGEFEISNAQMKRATEEARRRSTVEAGGAGGPSADLVNLQNLHERAKIAQRDLGIDETLLSQLPQEVSKLINVAADVGPQYEKFINMLDMLKQEGTIDSGQVFKSWRLYKMAVGDFFLQQAKEAESYLKEAEQTGREGVIKNAEDAFEKSISRTQDFIKRGLGKRSDIYTRDKKYTDPELAKSAGVFMSPEEIQKKAAGPIGLDPKLLKLYASMVRDLKPTTEGIIPDMAPAIDKAREAVSVLSNMDMELVKLMEDADLMKRIGPEITDAWDFESLVRDISKLREALEYFAKYNVSDESLAPQRKNIENLIKYLKNAESLYTPFATKKREPTGTRADYGVTGAIKVPKWLEPGQQVAMHKKNIESFEEYFSRIEDAGGPQIGRRMTYVEKVFDEAGNTIRNVAHDFRKYGETVNSAGEKISLFSKGHRDLVSIMQGSERSFSAAIMRAVRWGAASQIVYGGFSKLKQAVGTMADIETGLAQLRMVMNATTTDFDMLSGAAVGFAKQYGVGVTDVLKSMRIFAQQGLNQAEVIERTQTSTLAANVTTLSAKDATEALTAAMKVFGKETDSSMRYLDAWSEVEARHAITAGDMADAIKKSAAAAKNAGFTFDELNGIVAAVGSVTRQTGKEVGTSMRFIMRRLSSEKGPKELAKIGIPVMTEEGELRKGFDILNDLNKSWRDLTTAQKMATSQAIGGTRQYNALLVMMDNWDEALQATRDSINSKGSAERRNLELMKTYEKQVMQTEAAMTELQMSFGKIVLPAFKTALLGMRTFLETINNIPGPIKAAGAFAVALITYLAKGSEIVDAIRNKFGQGGAMFGGILGDISSELKATRYEVFGASLDKFLGPQLKKDIAGLKSLSKKAINEGTDFTVGPTGKTMKGPLLEQSGKSIDDFTSTTGKALFVLSELGMEFNKLIGEVATGTTKGFGTAGDALEKFSKKIGIFGNIGMFAAGRLIPGWADDIALNLVNAADVGAGALGKLFKSIEGTFGPAAAKWVEHFASENTNLVKAIAPLATFMFGMYKASDKLYSGYVRTTKSAQDYAKSQYGIKRAYEDQLKSIRTISGDYDNLQNKLEDIRKASQPDVKSRRQELGTYESPLLSMGKLYKNAISTTNQLAETNIGLVIGYDKLGNAILKSTGNLKEFITTAEKSRIKDIARTDIDVASKFIEDLTQIEGPEKWKEELRVLIKEVPLFGEMMAKGIKIGPAKALDTLSSKLNNLLAVRAQAPLSTVLDKDIKKYQDALKTVRTEFNTTYKDFRKLLSNIATTGLNRQEIANIFTAPELQKGYQLIVDVEPVLNTKALKGKVDWQDVMGAEVLRRVYPQLSSTLDITGALTKARLETAGAVAREGKVVENDLVMFMEGISDKYNIAGNQAIVSLKETTDGVFEWVATYFNTKTLQIEERGFDAEMQKFVENVFPQKAIEKDISDRIESLNEFVAGAGAGLRGISAKDFRRDFSLGERFYSDIETTTLLQGGKGFVPGGKGGTFGESPFQANWAETFKDFYVKPMQEYRLKLEQLEKLRLEGLEGNVTLATGMYEELVKLQEVLKNNQVVFQYRAVLADLTKTFEAGARTLQENLAVEKSRQELMKNTSGYMKGIAQDLDNLDLGAQKYSDLNVKQRSLVNIPEYKELAKELKLLNISREGTAQNVFATDKALVALSSISAVSKGFGATLEPEQLKNYTETVARTGSTGFAEMTLETSKVVDNTAATVETLDQILENLSNTEDLTAMLEKYGKETSPRSMVDAMEKVARIREKAAGAGNDELVITSNKALDILSKNLVEQEGVKRAIELVDSNFTLLGKSFRPEEMAQRAFGGLDQTALIGSLRGALPPEKEWFGLKTVEGQPTFERDVAKLIELQKQNNQEQLLSSKAAIKSAAALAIFETLQKSHTNKTIQKLDEQIKVLETKLVGEGITASDKDKATEELSVLKGMKGTEESKVKFHAVVQQMSAITSGSMQFAKAMGMSEDGIKKLGIGAVGLYGTMKLASTILGTDLPTAAKNFGRELENIAKAFAAGEKPGFYQFYKAKKAGEEFVNKSKEEGFSAGGAVYGPGGPVDDKILASLSNGEYVINAASTRKLGKDKLDYMNEKGRLPMMAEGGLMAKQPDAVKDIFKNALKNKEFLDTKKWLEDLEEYKRQNPNWEKYLVQGFASGGKADPKLLEILERKGYTYDEKSGKLSKDPSFLQKMVRTGGVGVGAGLALTGLLSLNPALYATGAGLLALTSAAAQGDVIKPDSKEFKDLRKEFKNEYPEFGNIGVQKKASGGRNVDDILAMVSNGEYVINTESARKIGYNELDYINKYGQLPKFAKGGVVGDIIAEKQAEEVYTRVTATLDNDSISRMTQALATALAATTAGYLAEKNAESTRLASLNKKAKKESEAIADLILRNKEAAQVVYDQMTGRVGPTSIPVKAKTEGKSLVLDTEKERKSVEKSLREMREAAEKEYKRLADEAAELQDKMARLEVREQLTMELEAVEKAVRDFKISDVIVRELEKTLFETNDLIDRIFNPFIDIFAKFKKYEASGLLTGKYRPQQVEFGPKTAAEMTPEESLVYRGRKLEPNWLERKTLETAGIPVEAVSFVKKDFGKIFKGLEDTQKERDIRIQKLQELSQRKGDLEELKKTKQLSSAEEEELKRLKEVTKDMTEELEDLTDEIEKTKNKLRKPLLEEQEYIKETQRQLEIDIAKGNKELLAGLKSGIGIFEGQAAPTQQPYDPGVRRLDQLTPYQFSERLARERGEEKPFEKYDKTKEDSLRKAIQDTNALLIKAKTAPEPDVQAIQVYSAQLEKQKKALKEVIKENNKYIEAIERRINADAELLANMAEAYNKYNTLMAFNTNRFVSNTAYGQPGLSGFGGEVAIAPEIRELTGQQALFAKGSDDVKAFINNFKFAQQQIDNFGSRIVNLTNERTQAFSELAASQPGTEAWDTAYEKIEKLNERIISLSGESDKLGKTLEPAMNALRIMADFANMLSNFSTAIDSLKMQQAVTSTKEYISYQDKLNKMYGSGSKFAGQYISVFDQFQAAAYGGKMLRPFESDQFDVQEADLRKRLFSGNLRGQDLWDTGLQLSMLPAERERSKQAEEITKARQSLTTQISPYQELVQELERTKLREDITPEQQAGITELQKYIQQAIDTAVSVSPTTMMEEGAQIQAFAPDTITTIKEALAKYQEPKEDVMSALREGLGPIATDISSIKTNAEHLARLNNIEISAADLVKLFGKEGLTNEQIEEVAPGLVTAEQSKIILDLIGYLSNLGIEIAKMFPILRGLTEVTVRFIDWLEESLTFDFDMTGMSTFWDSLKSYGNKIKDYVTQFIPKKPLVSLEEKAAGGFVSGSGGPKADTIPAMLSAGEYVVKTSSAKNIGYNNLEHINKTGRLPGFAEGGAISGIKDFYKKHFTYEPQGPIGPQSEIPEELKAGHALTPTEGPVAALGGLGSLGKMFGKKVLSKASKTGLGKILTSERGEFITLMKQNTPEFYKKAYRAADPAYDQNLLKNQQQMQELVKKISSDAKLTKHLYDALEKMGVTAKTIPEGLMKLGTRTSRNIVGTGSQKLGEFKGHFAEGGKAENADEGILKSLFNMVFGDESNIKVAEKRLGGRDAQLQNMLRKQMGRKEGGIISSPTPEFIEKMKAMGLTDDDIKDMATAPTTAITPTEGPMALLGGLGVLGKGLVTKASKAGLGKILTSERGEFLTLIKKNTPEFYKEIYGKADIPGTSMADLAKTIADDAMLTRRVFDALKKTGQTARTIPEAITKLNPRTAREIALEGSQKLGKFVGNFADGGRLPEVKGFYEDREQKLKEARDNARMNYSIKMQKMINQQPGLPQGLVTTPITSDLSRYDFDIPETASVRSSATRQGPLSRMTAVGIEAAKSGKLPPEVIEAYAKNLSYIRKGRKAGQKVTSRSATGQAMSIAMEANKQAEEVFKAQIADPKKIDAFYKDLEKRGVLGGFVKSYGAEGLKNVKGQAPGTTTFPGMMGMALGNKEWLNLFSKDKEIGKEKMSTSPENIEALIKQLLENTGAYQHKIKLAYGGLVSIPTMHTGGPVIQNGLHNLQKGEFVIPKAFAEGGQVDKTLGITTSISNASVSIDTDDLKSQIDRFEKIIEGMDLTIKNTEPLENLGETITVTAELADNKVYLENDTVTLDTSTLPDLTGTVGADELADKLDTAIASLDDRVSRLREESVADIEILTGQQEETSNSLYAKFDESIKLEKAVLDRKFNELTSDSKDNSDKATRTALAVEQQVNDLKRQINMINTQLYSKS